MAFTTNYSTNTSTTSTFTSTETVGEWIRGNAQKAKFPLITISTTLCVLFLCFLSISQKHFNICKSQFLCISITISNCMEIFGASLVMISIGIPLAHSSSKWILIILSTGMLLYTLIVLSFLCKTVQKNNNKYITSQLFRDIKILSFLGIIMLGINCSHVLLLFYDFYQISSMYSYQCYHFLLFPFIPLAHLCVSIHELY
eukprot:957400_1